MTDQRVIVIKSEVELRMLVDGYADARARLAAALEETDSYATAFGFARPNGAEPLPSAGDKHLARLEREEEAQLLEYRTAWANLARFVFQPTEGADQ